MTFLRTPGFDTPAELQKWLWLAGCDPDSNRLERGPDGKWRGSGCVRDRKDAAE